ncbi:MAG: 50S ribosomal protein L32 [candidate division NC10 bacterium]|nr:50S ribosomal protein L32 [candidate division NC10 bacterium]MCH7895504.1 50S ribosomal protein L32 [candidate division NC10 bacterium]MCZ6551878.1 50S ribosomal protein L32 [candidate division NC10 bacterium]
MGLPKRRHSHARTRMRRAHDALSLPPVAVCPHCREKMLPHRVCPSCGYYRGREVVKREES